MQTQELFIKRSHYNENSLLDKETFLSLMGKFQQLGFNKQSILLPIDKYQETRDGAPVQSTMLVIQDFLDLDRDFDAIIVRSLNEQTQEEIVLLFRNNQEKTLHFTDNLFPYINEELKNNLYVATKDPVRTYGLISYIEDFLKGKVNNPGLRYLIFLIGFIFFIISGYLLLVALLTGPLNLVKLIFASASLILGFIPFSFLPQRGLRVSTAKKARTYPPYIEKLKENWLLVIVTAVVSITATLILQYFGVKR